MRKEEKYIIEVDADTDTDCEFNYSDSESANDPERDDLLAFLNKNRPRIFDISGFRLRNCMGALANGLSGNPTLTHLNIRACGITDDNITQLTTPLRGNRVLYSLDISNNDLSAVGLGHLTQTLSGMAVGCLALNAMSVAFQTAPLATLLSSTSCTLERLELSHNLMKGKAEAEVLATTGLARNRSLRALNLSRNLIGNKGAIAIATAIKEGSKITDLDLGYNDIGDKGAVALASCGLNQRWSSLRRLVLESNRIEGEGACLIALWLLENTSLTFLSLKKNDISHVTSTNFFAFMLCGCTFPSGLHNTALRELDLTGAPIDITLFESALKVNPSVVALKYGAAAVCDPRLQALLNRNLKSQQAWSQVAVFVALLRAWGPVDFSSPEIFKYITNSVSEIIGPPSSKTDAPPCTVNNLLLTTVAFKFGRFMETSFFRSFFVKRVLAQKQKETRKRKLIAFAQ